MCLCSQNAVREAAQSMAIIQLTLSCLGLDFPSDQGDPGSFFLFYTCLSESSYLHRYVGGRKRRKQFLECDGKGGSCNFWLKLGEVLMDQHKTKAFK